MTARWRFRSAAQSLAHWMDLKKFTQAENLGLCSNGISDLAPLEGLVKLRELNLESNRIHNLSYLKGLTGLNVLLLSENQISDLTPLAGLTHLIALSLNQNSGGRPCAAERAYTPERLVVGEESNHGSFRACGDEQAEASLFGGQSSARSLGFEGDGFFADVGFDRKPLGSRLRWRPCGRRCQNARSSF